jgi:hypothetical protein
MHPTVAMTTIVSKVLKFFHRRSIKVNATALIVAQCWFSACIVAIPEGAEVTLELDKQEYFLGENVVLHWRIRNTGDEPFKFDFGGDGRTPIAKRAIRFKIEAVDAAGNAALDPYPNPMNMGGWGGPVSLDSGEDYWDDLQLMRYRELTKSGTYKIHVYHDLGQDKGRGWPSIPDPSDIPPEPRNGLLATTTLRFVMPTDEQARQVVKTILALPDDPNRTMGKRGVPFADFELLRYPVYLPNMKELAQQGDVRGLKAIGAMAFPEATAALLELMKSSNPAIATKAGDLVIRRTPNKFERGPSRGAYLVKRSWTDELKREALQPAWKLLAGNDREEIIQGASLIQALGTKDDLPALIQVMDRVLVLFKDHPIEQNAYLRPATASGRLADACQELIRRGAEPSTTAATSGQAMAFLTGLGLNQSFRPVGWRESVRALLQRDIPVLRALSLQNIPLPLDDAAIPLVARAIKDNSEAVQGAACDLAFKAKLKAFGDPLIDVLKMTENDWLLRGAFRAATECGVDNDRRLEICVGRLRPNTNDRNMVLLSLLADGSIEHHSSGANGIDDWAKILPDIQNAWLKFIASNRQALREGKRLGFSEPSLDPLMFPPGYTLSEAGRHWPPPALRPPLTRAELDHQEARLFRFVNDAVRGRINEWQREQPKTAEEQQRYQGELVINLDYPGFVLKDGTERERTAGLGSDFKWTIYRVTPEGAEELTAPVRLKLRGLASQTNLCKEVFVMQGIHTRGDRAVYVEITTRNLGFKSSRGIANLETYQFPDEQYAPTPTSIDESLLVKRKSRAK